MRVMGENARREYEAKYTSERNYTLLMAIYSAAIAHAWGRTHWLATPPRHDVARRTRRISRTWSVSRNLR